MSAEEHADTDTGSFNIHNCSLYPASLKTRVSGNIEPPSKLRGSQDIILQKPNEIQNNENCTSLKSKSLPPVLAVISEEVKGSLYYTENDHKIWDILEKIGSSTSLMKQELMKSQQREQALALEFQYLQHVDGDQSNGSGDIQVISNTADSVKKTENKSNKNKQQKRIFELGALEDKLQAVIFSLQKDNLSSVQQMTGGVCCWCLLKDGHTEKPKPEKDIEEKKDGCVCQWHLKVISRLIKAKLVLLDHLQQLQKEKEDQIQMTKQQLKKLNDQNVYIRNIDDKVYTMKSQQLQNYLLSFHSKGNDQELQKENIELKTEIKQLSITVRSLTDDNSKYKEIINTLTEEKNITQTQLIKNNEESKQNANELKTLLKTFEELANQNRDLQEERNHICIQNQHMTQALSDLKSENQRVQKQMCTLTRERDRLKHIIESIQKHFSQLEEETQNLQLKTNELYKEKSSLQDQLEKSKLQIQQMKEKEADFKLLQKAPLDLSREDKNDIVKLETAFQEPDNAKTALKKDQQISLDSSCPEEKLCCALKDAKAKNEILETGLLDMIRECQILSTMASGLKGENKILKAELKKHLEENVEIKLYVKRLNEEHKLLEKYLQTVENERDVLQYDIGHLHRDYTKPADQIAVQLDKPYKSNWVYCGQTTTSGSSEKKYHCEESTENIKDTSHCRQNTLACSSEEAE
uniref:Coiled-coil domain-containing protein 110 isoform X2 n=1 Tax=Geotrypetes seraphini TaxID=260995 RepID=A0A6P8RX53_GEOSA|nr:coiled-coil domain-containing protein 110 isoform X2 [Geotrypetes seraphini]